MPSRPATTHIRKKKMLEALEKTLGVVTKAARLAGMDRTAHYDWMRKDPKYKAAVEAIEDVALDFAESQLHKAIGGGDTTATIFYLKTKGKKRGYVERQEHAHEFEQPIFKSIELDVPADDGTA